MILENVKGVEMGGRDCLTCKFCLLEKRECRRGPPSVNVVRGMVYETPLGQAIWPTVQKGMWCWEWKDKDEYVFLDLANEVES